MLKLPTPVLGNITALTISTPDLEVSLAFYKKLGFSEVLRATWPFPWIQVSDGVLLIMLRQDPKPYIALTYYVATVDKVVKDLGEKGISPVYTPSKEDQIKRYNYMSPDGLNISLIGVSHGFSQPPGPGMLQMSPDEYFDPAKYVNKTAGMFGELAHPVADLEVSLAFWHQLGFSTLSKFTTPYPWAIVSDGLSIVGLHQSQHFQYPAITYFASDMPQKIAAMKKAGLKDLALQANGNTILITPEQQHIFLSPLGSDTDSSDKKKREIETNTIETSRLILKELTPETYDILFTTCSDEQIMSFFGFTDTAELEVERGKWQGGMTTYRTSFKGFILTEKTTGKAIGRTGFHNWYAMHNRAELGYLMSDEGSKGKGLMKEAVKAVMNYGFTQMGLQRIEAFVGPNNQPSQAIVRSLGFIHEGTLRQHFCYNGIAEDSDCFGMLKPEYEANKALFDSQ